MRKLLEFSSVEHFKEGAHHILTLHWAGVTRQLTTDDHQPSAGRTTRLVAAQTAVGISESNRYPNQSYRILERATLEKRAAPLAFASLLVAVERQCISMHVGAVERFGEHAATHRLE